MTMVSISGISDEVRSTASSPAVITSAVRRAQTLGLVGAVTIFDGSALMELARGAQREQVAVDASICLLEALGHHQEATAAWQDLYEALAESPIPDSEWKSARELFTNEELARLLGVQDPSTISRYVTGKRQTPQALAERLHTLMLIVADLRSTYNQYGIRQWFDRPRSELRELAPRDILQGQWDSHDRRVQAVRTVAERGTGFFAT